MFEEVCEYGLCDEDTKQCPLPSNFDAGITEPDSDNDGIPDSEDDTPNHNNGDLQFIIDLIEQSNLTIAPLELGEQSWEDGRLVEAGFAGTALGTGNKLTGSIPESVQNPSLLQHLDLSDNEMSGALPESMYTLTELVTLYIQYNAFPGALIQYRQLGQFRTA